MTYTPPRASGRVDPAQAWTVVTDAPLKGLQLAREAGVVLAWDEADQLYRIDARGQFQSVARCPGRASQVAISDDGSLVAILGEGSRLWLLDGDFNLLHDRPAISDPLSLAVDPHGRFAAVGSRMNLVQITNRHGKSAGRFETRQPLANMVFVPSHPFLIGTGAFGSIMGIALEPRGSGGLDGNVFWYEALMTSVGRLSTSGDGGMILIACFSHGVQKYDLAGHGEGSYHLGGSAAQAVPDFAGRSIAVATLEGELAVLSGAGNVRWKATLPRPATALEMDALGRYVVYGMATGEIVRLDLQGTGRAASPGPASAPASPASPAAPASESSAGRTRVGAAEVRRPDWTVEVVANEDHAEFAVLAVADSPPRIGVISPSNRLELYGVEGRKLGQAPEIDGVGRLLRVAPGWMAAATDRRIIVCDLVNNTARRVDLSLAELTHLAILPDSYGLGLIQERDRVGRATVGGRWIWKAELKAAVEEMAINAEGFTAITTDDGWLRVYNPAGGVAGESRGEAGDPALLLAMPEGVPASWVTLARRAQVLRGHDAPGRVVWEAPVPWEGWQLHAVGPMAVVVAPDGRSIAYDGSGRVVAQGRADGPPDAFQAGPDGRPLRIARQGMHLICSDLAGRVAWRAVADAPLGPIASGASGVAAMIGKSLAWFGTPRNP